MDGRGCDPRPYRSELLQIKTLPCRKIPIQVWVDKAALHPRLEPVAQHARVKRCPISSVEALISNQS